MSEAEITENGLPGTQKFQRIKADGFSDARLGQLTGQSAKDVLTAGRNSACNASLNALIPARRNPSTRYLFIV